MGDSWRTLQQSQAFQFWAERSTIVSRARNYSSGQSSANDLDEWTDRISAQSPVHGCDFLRAQLQQAH